MADEMNTSVTEMHRQMLRTHLGLPARPGSPAPPTPRIQPFFFIERAPDSYNGSRCKLPTCQKGRIQSGEYRIALNPAMDYGNFMRGRIESAGTGVTPTFSGKPHVLNNCSRFLRFLPRLMLRGNCRFHPGRVHPARRAGHALNVSRSRGRQDGQHPQR